MPIAVHYKFASMLMYFTIIFSGESYVLLSELKKSIMTREKLNAKHCDLKISDAQTEEEFTDDNHKVKKNASVIVRRVPRIKPQTQPYYHNQADRVGRTVKSIPSINMTAPLNVAKLIKTENLLESNASEEEKIKAMMLQSTSIYNSANFMNNRPLPATYVCFKCQIPGHHIRECPTLQDRNIEQQKRIKRSHGIPRSFLTEVDDPSMEGVMLGNDGRYVVPTLNAQAYEMSKKRKRPSASTQEDSGKQVKIAKTSD